ncbi:YciK family oxidoreductase [Marinobacterium sedimentorum]|uniref:YciK family oxidoreductase n=1 Tax=Marinobacterium sedimentorum TaxID=2927804 RepID=UPI0020C6B4A7|nr:YciK family oxidoreductase [Marinobacterium sedimentorum]MCP8689742.1 YciK family oxidoreductase [Marinobacterium sedimentorum]
MFEYKAPENLLQDRIILVTGAGAGIGRAAAIAYAALGATVVLAGRTLEKLEQVYDEIEAAGHPQPAIVPLNLESATEHEYQELANTLEQEFGHLDGLLHNASLLGLRTPIESYDPVVWNQVMQVNVNASFMLTQALIPLLNASQDASIVFTTSSVGRTGKAYWGAYGVSKFATEGLAQILAQELENTSNTRVNCINPGATRTQMRASAYPAENPGTNPTPEQIMPLYLYLMGPDSKTINGQSLDAQ